MMKFTPQEIADLDAHRDVLPKYKIDKNMTSKAKKEKEGPAQR